MGRAHKELGTLAAGTFIHLIQNTAGAQDGCPQTPAVLPMTQGIETAAAVAMKMFLFISLHLSGVSF